jgi:hypothetical protein
MALRNFVTATDDARPQEASVAATGRRSYPGGRSRKERSELGTKPCARCGQLFRRTPTRRLTCQSCYASNSEVDELASRAGFSSAHPASGG